MADSDERPEDMETKAAPVVSAPVSWGYTPSPLPHPDRTGTALTEDERRVADQHGDWQHGFTGVSEDDARTHRSAGAGVGLASDSGGTQSSPTLGTTENAGTAKRGTGGAAAKS